MLGVCSGASSAKRSSLNILNLTRKKSLTNYVWAKVLVAFIRMLIIRVLGAEKVTKEQRIHETLAVHTQSRAVEFGIDRALN